MSRLIKAFPANLLGLLVFPSRYDQIERPEPSDSTDLPVIPPSLTPASHWKRPPTAPLLGTAGNRTPVGHDLVRVAGVAPYAKMPEPFAECVTQAGSDTATTTAAV